MDCIETNKNLEKPSETKYKHGSWLSPTLIDEDPKEKWGTSCVVKNERGLPVP